MQFESNERRPIDYVLFGLAFLAFMMAVAGVVVCSVPAAITGFFVLLFAFLCYSVAQPADD